MVALFLSLAGASAAPAILDRDPLIAAALGWNALAWMMIARWFS